VNGRPMDGTVPMRRSAAGGTAMSPGSRPAAFVFPRLRLRSLLRNLAPILLHTLVPVLFLVPGLPAETLLAQPPGPVGPLPTPYQLDRLDRELFIFAHFGPNTFTGREWGEGTEPESLFNPTAFDAGQWCRIAKAAGAEGIIITAKHHDGFSTHTVRESPWRDGKGDVLRDLSDSCRAAGLKFGVYISPWDRNHPSYGTPEYNDVFVNTMKEIFAAYGPIYELWWDGANGEGPNGRRQEYDFRRFENTIREISPSTVIFSDVGPDLRWVGNESGIAGETNWNLLDTAGFGRGATGPPPETLNRGNEDGALWLPAECDVSIRPGWFYHANEDSLVKSPRDLMRIYLQSVGRGSTLLLNVPPGPGGLIAPQDSASLAGFRKLRDGFYRSNVATGGPATASASSGSHAVTIELDLGGGRTFNTVLLGENLALGQRVRRFSVQAFESSGWKEVASGTTIGRKRVIQVSPVAATKVRLAILDAKDAPAISSFALFNAPDYLNDR
jgi:alpha-L-fucosidase